MLLTSKYRAFAAAALAAVLFSKPVFVWAQVEVVDLQVDSTRQNGSAGFPARGVKPDPASMTEFYFQLQALQEEVQTLRGIIEEQSYQLKKLKQQRLDDYLDLDRRVSALTLSAGSQPATNASTSEYVSTPRAIDGQSPSSNYEGNPESLSQEDAEKELNLYRAGIDAVLKQRDYALGIEKFNQYLNDYSSGIYAPNAKYWLGQVYMQQNELDNAKRWFADLINSHPGHQKTPEAQFKLGKVMHLMGDTAGARSQLEAVAKSGSSAAKLARDYLTKHF